MDIQHMQIPSVSPSQWTQPTLHFSESSSPHSTEERISQGAISACSLKEYHVNSKCPSQIFRQVPKDTELFCSPIKIQKLKKKQKKNPTKKPQNKQKNPRNWKILTASFSQSGKIEYLQKDSFKKSPPTSRNLTATLKEKTELYCPPKIITQLT